MATADTTQPITATTSRLARNCAVGAGLLGSFLTGILVATGAADSGVGLTRTGWDLARAGAISCAIVAMLAAMTWWGVEQVVRRLGDRADRNRDAALAIAHRMDRLEASGADAAEMSRELFRLRGRLDATLMEQNELLQRLGQRLAVDVGVAYDLGAQSRD